MLTAPTPSETRRRRLSRRIRLIATATIAYNLIEAVIAVAAGSAVSSLALIGFGLDSAIEVLSAAAVLWQFSRPDPGRAEKKTLRVIAVAFFALALSVTAGSVGNLVLGVRPEHSTVGLILTAVSVVVMPFLSLAERRAGRELGSATAVADSKQTLVCTYLSGAVLIGLLLNTLFGLWWVDSVAALVIAGFALREGLEAWRGDGCAVSGGKLLRAGDEDDASSCTDGCCTTR